MRTAQTNCLDLGLDVVDDDPVVEAGTTDEIIVKPGGVDADACAACAGGIEVEAICVGACSSSYQSAVVESHSDHSQESSVDHQDESS